MPWRSVDEIKGMSGVRLFSLLGVFGDVLSLTLLVMLADELASGMSYGTGLTALRLFLGFGLPALFMLVTIVMVTAFQFVLLMIGFRHVSRLAGEMKTPYRFVGAGIIGLAVLVVGFGYIGAFASPLFNPAVPVGQIGTSSPSATGTGIVILLVGTGLTLVGAIGAAVGLWRLGQRFDEKLLRFGGVFYLIPVLNYAAPVMLFVGSGRVLRALRHEG